jgi:diguanylate cyclase (GGDEF)-like protein
MIVFDLGGCCSMSTVATTSINELPLWVLLSLSAICGAVVAGGGALVFDRLLGSRKSGLDGGDSVTSAASRREFIVEIESAWRAWTARGRTFGLLVVDVDCFADINQLYGRSTGDRVLIEVAEQVHRRVGPESVLARIDADEFAVVCHGASLEDLEDLRHNIEAYVTFAHSVPLSLSTGLATPHNGDSSGIDLLIRARESRRRRREDRPVVAVETAISDLLLPR